jgi:hypothetical protein
MKRRLIYLYTFIGITVLLSSAKLLKGNRSSADICTSACTKTNKKSSGAELFLPLHFISIMK